MRLLIHGFLVPCLSMRIQNDLKMCWLMLGNDAIELRSIIQDKSAFNTVKILDKFAQIFLCVSMCLRKMAVCQHSY